MATPLFKRKAVLHAKIEAVYGTDPGAFAAANAILVRNLNLTPLEVDYAPRDLQRPYFGNSENLPTRMRAMVEFEVEMAGAGAAGTAPKYGPLLRACGMAETINAGVSVVYAPVSAAFESNTLYFNMDGLLHKLLGARGTVTCRVQANQIPVYAFRMTGLYVEPTDTAAIATDYTGFTKPVPALTANTTPFTLQGYSPVADSLSIDLGNNVVHRSLIGGESILITDRKVSGEVVMESMKNADKNFWTAVAAATTAALQCQHGTVAGNIVVLDAPKTQVTAPRYSDSDGISMTTYGLVMVPNGASGNDEFTITVK
jgi:hypothetical protein